MDTISSISKGWRLCTIASFIGCSILIFFLKHSHDSEILSTPGYIPMKLTISANDSDPNMQFLQLSNFNQHMKQINEEDKCNMFDGKWVYEPKQSRLYEVAECPFLSDQVSCQRNGRIDFMYERWSWEAKGCKIPR